MKLIQNQPWLLPTGLVLLAALSANEPLTDTHAADELRYHSVAERTLEKRFVQHSEMDLVDTQFKIEGPDDPEVPEMEKPNLKIVDDETIEFSDETLAADEGRPKKLKRSFTTIENSTEYKSDDKDAEDSTIKNESGLADKSVLFTWNDESKKFDTAWSGDEGDDALLAPMVEDADFRAWLPGKKVEEGDSWSIPTAEFHNLQEPSGPMGYHPEGETDKADEDATSVELRDNLKGELKATYKGTRDENGVKVGVIAFEGKLNSLSEHDVDQEEGPSMHQSTELSDELEGELLWNLAEGHFQSLSCDSAQKMSTAETQSFEVESATFKITQGRTFEGKKTYRFSCSAKKS